MAVAILALVGWWLFRGGPDPARGPAPEPEATRLATADTVSSSETQRPASSATKPGPAAAVPPGPDAPVVRTEDPGGGAALRRALPDQGRRDQGEAMTALLLAAVLAVQDDFPQWIAPPL